MDDERLVDEVTRTLLAARAGEEGAFDQLFGLVYDDLKRIARRQLFRLRPGETLDTTGLVHEAYLKLVDQKRYPWRERGHFYAVAARAMRQVLVDYARRVGRSKRGAGAAHVALEEDKVEESTDAEQILAVDEALKMLDAHSSRLARVVEYRFFAGFTEEEIAEVLAVTSRTVRNDWTRAKIWLAEAMRSNA